MFIIETVYFCTQIMDIDHVIGGSFFVVIASDVKRALGQVI